MHKIGQSGVFLGRCLESILKTGFLLMKNLLKPLAKSVLVSLGLIAAASTTGAAVLENVWIRYYTLNNF